MKLINCPRMVFIDQTRSWCLVHYQSRTYKIGEQVEEDLEFYSIHKSLDNDSLAECPRDVCFSSDICSVTFPKENCFFVLGKSLKAHRNYFVCCIEIKYGLNIENCFKYSVL